ncbi:hypothetical protein KJ596_01235 [Patescibacteria group bacterium]|nr:hypothetical protein [Patescibacteria group bacterium]MBU1868047.1 hypothetical protein [Patescibacteria group bacterium]
MNATRLDYNIIGRKYTKTSADPKFWDYEEVGGGPRGLSLGFVGVYETERADVVGKTIKPADVKIIN